MIRHLGRTTPQLAWISVLSLVVAGLLAGTTLAQPPKPKSKSTPQVADAVKKLELAAEKCRTATEVVSLYQICLAENKLGALDKRDVEAKLVEWQARADAGLIRVGKKWITPDEEKQLAKEADALVEQAMLLLKTKAYKQADDKLSAASKLYPDHLPSVFLLALGALLNDNFPNAEKQFSEMLKRAPGNVAILNNLAVAEAMNGRVDKAITHLEKAATLKPDHPCTVQNMGNLVKLLENPRPGLKVKADKKVRDRAATAFATLSQKSKASYSSRQPFLMDFDFIEKDENGEAIPPAEADAVVGSGSGFVIAEGYILTNRHVVEDGESFGVVDPTPGSKKVLNGEVVAIDTEFDLALVKCTDLTSPPVALGLDDLPRGSEVLALGFPLTSVVGTGLKATRGIVTGLPSAETENMMVLDVQINPGNSGGPLCDGRARIVGINTAVTFSSRFVQGYGLALPIVKAMTFIKKQLPDFKPAENDGAKKEWTEVDAAISPSTVMILVKKKIPTGNPPPAGKK